MLLHRPQRRKIPPIFRRRPSLAAAVAPPPGPSETPYLRGTCAAITVHSPARLIRTGSQSSRCASHSAAAHRSADRHGRKRRPRTCNRRIVPHWRSHSLTPICADNTNCSVLLPRKDRMDRVEKAKSTSRMLNCCSSSPAHARLRRPGSPLTCLPPGLAAPPCALPPAVPDPMLNNTGPPPALPPGAAPPPPPNGLAGGCCCGAPNANGCDCCWGCGVVVPLPLPPPPNAKGWLELDGAGDADPPPPPPPPPPNTNPPPALLLLVFVLPLPNANGVDEDAGAAAPGAGLALEKLKLIEGLAAAGAGEPNGDEAAVAVLEPAPKPPPPVEALPLPLPKVNGDDGAGAGDALFAGAEDAAGAPKVNPPVVEDDVGGFGAPKEKPVLDWAVEEDALLAGFAPNPPKPPVESDCWGDSSIILPPPPPPPLLG